MPSEVFEFNMWKAWGAVFVAVASMAASEYLISVAPWPLLPFAWALAGTAFTGVSSAGRLCALAGLFLWACALGGHEPLSSRARQRAPVVCIPSCQLAGLVCYTPACLPVG